MFSAWLVAWMAPPSSWLRAPSGLTTSPTSATTTSRVTRTSLVTSTSATTAQWAPSETAGVGARKGLSAFYAAGPLNLGLAAPNVDREEDLARGFTVTDSGLTVVGKGTVIEG